MLKKYMKKIFAITTSIFAVASLATASFATAYEFKDNGKTVTISQKYSDTTTGSAAKAPARKVTMDPRYIDQSKMIKTPTDIFLTKKWIEGPGDPLLKKSSATSKPYENLVRKINQMIVALKELSAKTNKHPNSLQEHDTVEGVIKKYQNSLKKIASIIFYNERGFAIDNGDSGFQPEYLYKIQKIFELNKLLNNLLSPIDKSKVLSVTTPKNIYDLGLTPAGSNPIPTKTQIPEADGRDVFNYEVANISSKSVTDAESQRATLEINVQTKNATGGVIASKTYSLVFNGRDKHLIPGKDKYTLKQLLDMRYIYFRDNSKEDEDMVDDAATIEELKDLITISRDQNGDFKVFVHPGDKTVNFFVPSNQDGKGAIDLGIFDYSLSPLHTKATLKGGNYVIGVDPNNPMIKAIDDKTQNGFKVYKSGAKWKIYDSKTFKIDNKPYNNVRVMQFYIDNDVEFRKDLYWNGVGKDAFKEYRPFVIKVDDQGLLTASPEKIDLMKEAMSGATSQPIVINTKEVTLNSGTGAGKKRRTLTLVTIVMDKDKSKLSFSSNPAINEPPVTVTTPAVSMFFEKSDFSTHPKAKTNNQRIPVNQYQDNTGDLQNIMGTVYDNWMGSFDKNTKNANYIPRLFPKTLKSSKEARAYQKFIIKYHKYIEKAKNGGTALVRGPNVKTEVNGRQLVELANNINNEYIVWIRQNLNLDPSVKWNSIDFYKPTDSAGGYFKKLIEQGTRSEVIKKAYSLMQAAMRIYNGQEVTDEEEEEINPTKPDGVEDTYYKVISGKIEDASLATDKDKERVKQARIAIRLFVEKQMAKIMNDSINKMYETFQTLSNSAIHRELSEFINRQGKYKAINPKALERFTVTVNGKKMTFVASHNNNFIYVNSGKDLIKSLVTFFNKFKLQEKYLTPSESLLFDGYMKTEAFWDPKTYSDENNIQTINNIVTILDKISKKINKEINIGMTLADIVEDKLALVKHSEANWTAKRMNEVLSKMVSSIADTSSAVKYTFMNRHFKTSYFDNLATGYNLKQIYERYLNEHPNISDEDKDIINKVIHGDSYSTELIVKIAINNKYYNVPYFLDGTSKKPRIAATASELLGADLAKSVNIELPESNTIISAITNPNTIATWGLFAIGVLMSLIGSIILFISFKSKNNGSRRATIIIRVTFMLIIAAGIVMVLAPVLLGSTFAASLGILSA